MSDTDTDTDDATIVDDGPGEATIPLEVDGRQIAPARHAPRVETLRIPGGGIIVGETIPSGAWMGTSDTVDVRR